MSKTLHIVYSGVGGMAEVALSLLECVSNGDQHHLLFYGNDSLSERYQERCKKMGISFSYIFKRQGLDLRSDREVFQFLRKLSPRVVVAHMTQTVFAFLWFRLTSPKSKLIVVEHHSNALKSAKDWVYTVVNHLAASRSVFLTDQYARDVARKLGPLYRKAITSVIPNGVNLEAFAPNSVDCASPSFVGMQARMVEGKDYETLLRAWKLAKEKQGLEGIRLELAGDGPERGRFEKLAKDLDLGDSVTFCGMLPQAEMIAALKRWDVFVLSTLGETMSRALMEAQAVGVPIVATDAPGVSTLINDKVNGLLVPMGDVESMSQGLCELLGNHDLRQRLGKRGREIAMDQFSVTKAWNRYEALISEISGE